MPMGDGFEYFIVSKHSGLSQVMFSTCVSNTCQCFISPEVLHAWDGLFRSGREILK